MNMSYCMMENTNLALEQVMNALVEGAELSESEMLAYESLKSLCLDFENMPEPTLESSEDEDEDYE